MKRNAFTLIEIMVAIVILTILGGLLLFALRGAGNSAKVNATKITLENLKSMLAEYELKTKLATFPGAWYANVDPGTTSTPAGADFWHSIDVAGNPLRNPFNVADMDSSSKRFTSCATANTLIAMREIAKIPSNQAVIGKLPPNQLMKGVNGAPLGNAPLLDAWDNPIIFVPGSGLATVTVGGNTITITAPNNRPFFASAGPDGDFSKGDDNLYSFEQ